MLLLLMKKIKAATNTPLPNAIIVAVIYLGKFTNRATTEPNKSGILATKPQAKESKIVLIIATWLTFNKQRN